MRISRAAVVANEKKPIARSVKREVRKFLEARGIQITNSSPQLVVSVGGDGTVLFSKKHYGVPFFAIGSSTSFICQAKFSNWEGKLARALASPCLEKRLMLSCFLDGKRLPPALNEVGIRNPEPRVLSIHLSAGKKQYAFRADGILLSTPTGSPAYAYSCGGREMKKTDRKYQAVAISPFRRLFSPLLLSASTRCALRISGHERAQLFLDGQIVRGFTEKNSLSVSVSKKPFYFLKA
jgi:NAD+ kinase